MTSATEFPILWVSVVLVVATALLFWPKRPRYSNAPTVPTSLFEKLRNITGMTAFLAKGYAKHGKAGTFQYTTIRGRRQVIVCNDTLINELKNAKSENLSFAAWIVEMTQISVMFPNHTDGAAELVRSPTFAKLSHTWFRQTLTKGLDETFPQLHKDLDEAFTPEVLGEKVGIYQLTRKCIIGTICRYLVGEPLCKDIEFLEAVNSLTEQIGIAGQVASIFPGFLKPYVVRYLTGFNKPFQAVRARLRELAEKGDTARDDFFSMSLAELVNTKRDAWTLERLVTETSTNAFAAHHTTSATIAQILLELAARPEYQAPLRAEIRSVVAEKGWTMEAMDLMLQLDSFMRETRRLRPLADIILNRLAISDTTFSDGTTVPRGTFISAAYSPRELDAEFYPSPEVFDGFRYYKMQSEERFTDVEGTRYLGFGGGKHACPGRFFATAMVKASVAILLEKYELNPGSEKLEFETKFEEQRLPSVKDNVLFKALPRSN